MQVKPVTLEGRAVRLEPMDESHLAALFEAAQDDEIWTYLPPERPRTMAEMRRWFDAAMALRRGGQQLPYTIVEPASGRPIGGTRYMAINPTDRSVEIGHSWVARPHRRSAVNTETKYLMLRHAFETLGCIRVWFKSDARNLNSHRAIERLGAVREGVLRKHMIVKGGYARDSVVFSILDDEWPACKHNLERRLGYTVACSETGGR